jgi:hypothetical protein
MLRDYDEYDTGIDCPVCHCNMPPDFSTSCNPILHTMRSAKCPKLLITRAYGSMMLKSDELPISGEIRMVQAVAGR